jgi:hypothetical protein
MGDYRNELQSALSQVEALRTENAALRMKLRAAGSAPRIDELDVGFDPPPAEGAPLAHAARPRWKVVALGLALAGLGVVAATTLVRTPRARGEERLSLPDLPVEHGGEAPAPLPVTPRAHLLPSRQTPEVTEVRDVWVQQEPIAVDPFRALGLRWPTDTRVGLYVLHTTPAAQCSVGGVILASPSSAFITEGTHRVRCQVGLLRHTWEVRIAARRVTFDTLHNVASP